MITRRLTIDGCNVRVALYRPGYYLAERFDADWRTRPVPGPERIFTGRKLSAVVRKALEA